MIQTENLPSGWTWHTHLNNANYYRDTQNHGQIRITDSGELKIENTSNHPNNPYDVHVNERFPTEEQAEEAAKEWMKSGSLPDS